jgi:hypothetical protein
MNPFVDYQKRDVELPNGCKDLIDMFRRRGGSEPPAREPSTSPQQGEPAMTPQHGEPATTLADVGQFLSRFLSSSAAAKSLWIDCGATALLGLFDGKHGMRALVLVDAAREQSVREVLGHAGLTPDQDDPLENGRGLQFALASSSGIEQFVVSLLLHGFGVDRSWPIGFRFRERKAV